MRVYTYSRLCVCVCALVCKCNVFVCACGRNSEAEECFSYVVAPRPSQCVRRVWWACFRLECRWSSLEKEHQQEILCKSKWKKKSFNKDAQRCTENTQHWIDEFIYGSRVQHVVHIAAVSSQLCVVPMVGQLLYWLVTGYECLHVTEREDWPLWDIPNQ